ncbi:hypothetical protein M9434_001701 [Picochlorum sp. BPE23]|nr:hypothetical protein M9434_001701 [Picochlorum sp. BPE23]
MAGELESLLGGIFWNDDGDDIPSDSREILKYNYLTGKLFVVCDEGTIRYANAREGILKDRWPLGERHRAEETTGSTSVGTLQPVPDVEINVEKCVMNKSGTIAVVAGTTMRDPEISGAMLIDVGAPGGRLGNEVSATEIDSKLFESRPGLHVTHMEWHPDSEHHVVILTSDNVLRLYDLEQPDFAEQIFELKSQRLSLKIEEEDTDWNDPVPISFGFGRGSGWSRVSIVILMSDGNLKTLCPVIPFGARYSGRWIAGVIDTCGSVGERKYDESMMWIHKAFNIEANDLDEKTMYRVVPHALESHVPRLSPSLRIESNAAEKDKDSALGFQVSAFHVWHIGASLLGVAMASDTGMLRTGVVTTSISPLWACNPPQCIFRGGSIAAVRSQCVDQRLLDAEHRYSSASFVVIDDIVLPDGSRAESTSYGEGAPYDIPKLRSDNISILRDTASPATLLICQQHLVHSVTLAWALLLGDHVSHWVDDVERKPLPDVLPFPSVVEIHHVDKNASPMVSHAVIGDKLSGSAVLSVMSDGTYMLNKIVPKPSTTTPVTQGSLVDFESRRKEIGDHVQAMYAPITAMPSPGPSLQFDRSAPVDSPQNYRALVENIASLRSSYIEFCHKAECTTADRLDFLKDEVSQQFEKVEKIANVLEQIEKKQKTLRYRQDKVQFMASNINDRVKLLAELHWAVPQPASEAEKHFQHHELPMLESNTASLAQEVAMLRSQAQAVKQSGKVQQSHGSASKASPSDLRRIREMLSEHDTIIRDMCRKVRAIESSV